MSVTVGVDIGSLTAKTVIVDSDCRILAYKIIRGKIVDETAAIMSMRQALNEANLSEQDIEFLITTGYGRNMVNFGNKSITEISCHARELTSSIRM